jgi:hypothetical protein
MDISEKALARVNEVRREYPNAADYTASHIALCRAIEQHEATKQERDNLATALKETAAACADHVNTILQLRSELAGYKQEVSDALVDYFGEHLVAEDGGDTLASFIIPKPKPDPLSDALLELADAEKNYRWLHDTQGGGHIDTGRAWDKMRRAGDKATAVLAKLGGQHD